MSIGDFHLHSTRSDGQRTPTEVVALAYANGVRVMALTDHDTVAGLAEARTAAAPHPDLTLLPGVELSCDVPGTEVHMLGLGIDPTDPALLGHLHEMQDGRLNRAERMVERLAALGYPLSWERVRAIAGDASVGRPHIAHALLEAGHTQEYADAFDRFIGRDGPAYVERPMLSPGDAVRIIRAAGGLAVFAHPLYTTDFERFLPEAVEAGLFGIEVFYRHHSAEEIARLAPIAEQAGLFAIGGSDFHGIDRADEREPGDLPLPDEQTHAFLRAARDHGCTLYGPTA